MNNDFSKELLEKTLKATWNNFDGLDDGVHQMAEMWKTSNDELLLELTNSFFDDEEYNKAMIVDHNIDMVKKNDGYLKNGKGKEYFIVVGAAHYLASRSWDRDVARK